MNRRKKAEKLYDIYRADMLIEALQILDEQTLAEDAVSESFIRIMKHLDGVEAVNCPKTCNFLKIICRNVAIDMYRKRMREAELIVELTDSGTFTTTPEDVVLDRESTQKIVEIISRMDSKYKDVLIMNRIYHFKNKEIAAAFGITEEAVKKRLQRAKAEVRKQLAKEEI